MLDYELMWLTVSLAADGERGADPGRPAVAAPRRQLSSEPRADLSHAGEAGAAAAQRPASRLHRRGALPGVGEQRAAATGQRARGDAQPRGYRPQSALRDRAGGRAHGAGRDGAGARTPAARAGQDKERARAAAAHVRLFITHSLSHA